MNILSLNLCGWGDKPKRRRLATLIRSGKFDLICLQETKKDVIDEIQLGLLWVNQVFDWSVKSAHGLPGVLFLPG